MKIDVHYYTRHLYEAAEKMIYENANEMTIFEDTDSLNQGYARTEEEQRNRMIRRSFAKAKKDYLHQSNSPDDFYAWMEDTYGIQFEMDNDTNTGYNVPVAKGWKVVDEVKFLAYYLKYQ